MSRQLLYRGPPDLLPTAVILPNREREPYIHSGILKIYIWRACCSESTLGSNPNIPHESASGRHCKGVTNKLLAAKRMRIKYFSAFGGCSRGEGEKRPFSSSGLFHTLTISWQPTPAEQLPASHLSYSHFSLVRCTRLFGIHFIGGTAFTITLQPEQAEQLPASPLS